MLKQYAEKLASIKSDVEDLVKMAGAELASIEDRKKEPQDGDLELRKILIEFVQSGSVRMALDGLHGALALFPAPEKLDPVTSEVAPASPAE